LANQAKKKGLHDYTLSDVSSYLPPIKAVSLWDYAMKAKEAQNIDFEEKPHLYYPSKALDVLYDVFRKQYLNFDLGKNRQLELAGPKGPDLTKRAPGIDPGYSAKYTWDF